MDWLKEIDWEKMRNPHPDFRLFAPEKPDDPTDPFYVKVARLRALLMKRPLWLSDEYRTTKAIDLIITSYFSGFTLNVFYEWKDFGALIGFMDILPEFKCSITLKLIDPKIWGADFVRASRELIDMFMKNVRLRRISIETADPRIERMARWAGFVIEGKRPDDLRWDKKYYPKYILGKYGVKQ